MLVDDHAANRQRANRCQRYVDHLGWNSLHDRGCAGLGGERRGLDALALPAIKGFGCAAGAGGGEVGAGGAGAAA